MNTLNQTSPTFARRTTARLTPRERVKRALRHQEPDRVPTDFLATPEVWNKLIAHEQPDASGIDGTYIEPAREALLRHFEIDSRVLSYDMFIHPPDSILHDGAVPNGIGGSPVSITRR